MHTKWGENPNAIAPDTEIEGDHSNANNTAVLLNKNDFNYSSVVGIVLCLVGHTHPDITWAVDVFCTIPHLED